MGFKWQLLYRTEGLEIHSARECIYEGTVQEGELNIVGNCVLFIRGVSSLNLPRFLSFVFQSLCFSDSCISELRNREETLIACISFKYPVLASIPGTDTFEI
jgi:hypothetical protein